MKTRLIRKWKYHGIITLESGLLIGGPNNALAIGGPDKQVVRNPIDNIPYIPGSSLKGKMRALIEWSDGSISPDQMASNDPEARSSKLFGFTDGPEGKERQASRLIVRDAMMREPEKFRKKVKTDLYYTESKAENSINRVTAEANPRTFERVPKGAEFDFEMILNVFEPDDNEVELKKTVEDAIYLLERDYLGAGGSRGNGQISIDSIWTEIPLQR